MGEGRTSLDFYGLKSLTLQAVDGADPGSGGWIPRELLDPAGGNLGGSPEGQDHLGGQQDRFAGSGR